MEQIEMDLEINDGQVDIDLEVDTGVPNYLAMRGNDTLNIVNETVYPLEDVGEYTFAACKNLKEIDLPNVKTVGSYAFKDCHRIESIYMPNVTTFGTQSFGYLGTLSNGIDELHMDNVMLGEENATQAFYYSNIRKISMAHLDFTRTNPFSSANAEELDIPAQSTAYGFSNMPNLKTLFLPSAKETRYRYSGTSGHGTTVESCPQLNALILPALEEAGGTIASNCKTLKTVFMPNLRSLGVDSNSNVTLLSNCAVIETLSLPSLKYMNITEERDYKYTYSYSTLIASSCASIERVYLPNLEQAAFNGTINSCPKLNGLFMPSLIRRYSSSDTQYLLPSNYNNDFTLYTPSCNDWRGYINYNSSSFKCPNFWWVIGKETDSEPCLLRSQIWGTYKPTNINIYVPDHLVDAYKTATNWSLYATYIKPQSEMPQELTDRIEAEMIPPEDPDFEAMGINIEEATA